MSWIRRIGVLAVRSVDFLELFVYASKCMKPNSVDKNDLKDVQLQDADIMYDIASSVETIISTWDFVEKMNYGLTLKQVMARNCKKPLDYDWKYKELKKEIQKVYEFKRFLDRLNDDAIVIPHEDAQATLGDTNDPFTSISMSKDFADKNIAANDAY
ncbi:hypothetical protein Tco_0864340 [Tanacetum coccineum]